MATAGRRFRLLLYGVLAVVAVGGALALATNPLNRQFDVEWRDAEGRPTVWGSQDDREYELRIYRGSEHCDLESAVNMRLAWPLGTSVRVPEGENYHRFIRDPEGVYSYDWSSGKLDLTATLPKTARGTEYRSESGWRLWVDGGDEPAFLYLVNDERVERWPRVEGVHPCM